MVEVAWEEDGGGKPSLPIAKGWDRPAEGSCGERSKHGLGLDWRPRVQWGRGGGLWGARGGGRGGLRRQGGGGAVPER